MDYSDILSLYHENKDKKWEEWLEYDPSYSKAGKQSIVGLFRLKANRKVKILFKFSQYIDSITEHEDIIMKGLDKISDYCPHFCRVFGLIKCSIDPSVRIPKVNPFIVGKKPHVTKDVLLCEFIDNSCKFSSYIYNTGVKEMQLYSIVKQVLLSVTIAQQEKEFVHYDLQSNNILIKSCDKNIVFQYILDEENQFCIPTLGVYPVIIDFGFAYIEDMLGKYFCASLAHTDIGFMTDRFDQVADPKLFLVLVSGEIKDAKNSKCAKKLRRIVRNLFNPLCIDWLSGWDNKKRNKATEYVLNLVKDYSGKSRLFSEFDYLCIDIIQNLIRLPLYDYSYSDIHIPYQAFLDEWVKIENEITDPVYNMYILQGIVKAAISVMSDYFCDETKDEAVMDFRIAIYERIEEIADFCDPQGVNWEIMLCSLYLYARGVEGVLCNVVESRMFKKEKEYEKLTLIRPEQMYASIDINIPDSYQFNKNSKIYVFDCIKQEHRILSLTDSQIEEINGMSGVLRGGYLYEIEKEKL